MKKRSLQFLFEAMYHDKYDFQDFLNGAVDADYSALQIGSRHIIRPNKKLKAYHLFIQTFLVDYLRVNMNVAHAYRRGVSLRAAVTRHSLSKAFFQTDVEHFFPSIDREIVRKTVSADWERLPILDAQVHIERILDLVLCDDALPIGYSTSPAISNACLTAFDDDLESFCTARSLIYTRYSDDIAISGKARSELIGLESEIQSRLTEHLQGKLTLNPAKTKRTSVGRKIKLLGMVILPTGHVTVDMDLKKKIEVMLHFYISDRNKFLDLAQVKGDMDAGIVRLEGYVNYINSSDKLYLDKLRRKFGATVIDSFLHRSAS